MAVEVSADVHQFLFSLCIQFRVVASVPPQLKEIGMATHASNLEINECHKEKLKVELKQV
jgi:hypothetical protein